MNKLLKFFVYTSLTIQLLIVGYELFRIFFVPIPSYLSSYDITENKVKYIKLVIYALLKICIFYFIVLIVCLEPKDENFKELAVSENYTEDENRLIMDLQYMNNSVQSSYNNKWVRIHRFANFYKAHIAVYLYLISINLKQMNPILFLIAPFLMYRVLYKLYSKHKYTKIFLWSALVGLATAFYTFLSFKKRKVSIANDNEIPKEILIFLTKKGYEVGATKIEADFYNVGVIGVFNSVAIFIFGDVWNLFTTKEFISVLYHEVGHVMNRSLLYRLLISKALDIWMYIVEFLMIYKSKSLIRLNNTDIHHYINNLICLYVILCISVTPYINMINNIVSYVDEIEADRFSAKKHNKEYLIEALIKLTIENKGYFDSSLLFNFFTFSHPCLKRRLEYINNM